MVGIVIAGMHHSGTSVVAGLLQSAGLSPGENLIPESERDGKDFREDSKFVELNRRWLAAPLTTNETPNDWGTESGIDRKLSWTLADVGLAKEYVEGRNQKSPHWIAKDPRSSLTLPIWRSVGDLRFLFVYRSPWDVVESLTRFGDPFSGRAQWALQVWQSYNRRILLEAQTLGPRCMVVSSSSVLRNPERFISTISEWTGASLDLPNSEKVIDKTKFRDRDEGSHISRLFRILNPSEMRTLDKLDKIATLPRGMGKPTQKKVLKASIFRSVEDSVQVIIPCRNDGQYLAEAVSSVELATEAISHPVELTIVNARSTDSMSKKYFRRLRRAGYHVISERSLGPSAARNSAFRRSRAKAVIPLDADNRLLPNLLQGAQLVIDDRADVVYGPWRRFGSDPRDIYPPGRIDWNALYPSNTVDNCAVISRQLLRHLGGWDNNMIGLEDWDLWLRALQINARFHCLEGITFEYLVRPGSMTWDMHNTPNKFSLTVAKVIARHVEAAQAQGLDTSIWRQMLTTNTTDPASHSSS